MDKQNFASADCAELFAKGELTSNEITTMNSEHEAEFEQFMAERAASMETMPPEMMQSGMFDDTEFCEAMGQARSIDFAEDFGGFKLATGINEHGTITLYIENGIKGGANLAITLPFTREQLETAL